MVVIIVIVYSINRSEGTLVDYSYMECQEVEETRVECNSDCGLGSGPGPRSSGSSRSILARSQQPTTRIHYNSATPCCLQVQLQAVSLLIITSLCNNTVYY